MFGKKKLLDEITRLSYRVAELEERLCPCESHDWKKIDYNFCGGTGMGDEETIYTYKCAKCGKQRETWKLLRLEGCDMELNGQNVNPGEEV